MSPLSGHQGFAWTRRAAGKIRRRGISRWHRGIPTGRVRWRHDRAADQHPGRALRVIHLGGEAAAIVPLTELRRLQAVERRARLRFSKKPRSRPRSQRTASGSLPAGPGAVSHDEAMAELLSGQ